MLNVCTITERGRHSCLRHPSKVILIIPNATLIFYGNDYLPGKSALLLLQLPLL